MYLDLVPLKIEHSIIIHIVGNTGIWVLLEEFRWEIQKCVERGFKVQQFMWSWKRAGGVEIDRQCSNWSQHSILYFLAAYTLKTVLRAIF